MAATPKEIYAVFSPAPLRLPKSPPGGEVAS
jgi:hypothetical protein